MAHAPHQVADNLRRAHEMLAEDISQLDRLLAAPADCQPAQLQAWLKMLRAALLAHFHWEEEDGYMTEVEERRPYLTRAVEQLRQEHRTLAHGLEELLEAVTAAEAPNEDLCARAAGWLRGLRDHERRENLLVEDTFNQDEGTKD